MVYNQSDRRGIIDPERPSGLSRPKDIWREFILFSVHSWRDETENLEYEHNWRFLPHIISNISRATASLESSFSKGGLEKLLYIGKSLKVAGFELQNRRFRLVMLTSILEMMVTHNPDSSRFNVENSINKQFQLKTSLLVYLNNRGLDVNTIKKRLRVIYQQRSNIAHGNFREVEKYISKLSQKDGEEEYFDDLVVDLYQYIRAVVEEYLKDKVFVDFLKDN